MARLERRPGEPGFFQRNGAPVASLADLRRRLLGAGDGHPAADLHDRLLVPPEAADGAARRPARCLYAGQLPLFPVRLARRHEPLEHHPSLRLLHHHLRLDRHNHRQFRHLLSARLLHGAGGEAEGGGAADAAARRALLGQRDFAGVRLPGDVRHRRHHQPGAARRAARSTNPSTSSARTWRSMRGSPTPTCSS